MDSLESPPAKKQKISKKTDTLVQPLPKHTLKKVCDINRAIVNDDQNKIDTFLSLDDGSTEYNRQLHHALMTAAQFGKLSTLISILERKRITVNNTDKQGRTPLMYAAINQDINMVRFLCQQDLNLSVIDGHHKNVFHYAVSSEHEQILALLCKKAHQQNQKHQIIELYNQPDKRGQSIIHKIFQIGSMKLLSSLQTGSKQCNNIGYIGDKIDSNGLQPIVYALINNHESLVLSYLNWLREASRMPGQIVKEGDVILDYPSGYMSDRPYKTAIFSVFKYGSENIFKCIMINHMIVIRQLPAIELMKRAVQNPNCNVIFTAYLRSHQAAFQKSDLCHIAENICLATKDASSTASISILNTLLNYDQFDPNDNKLLFYCVKHKLNAALKVLLSHHRVNPNEQDKHQKTILMYAIIQTNVEMTRIILSCDRVNLMTLSNRGTTVLSDLLQQVKSSESNYTLYKKNNEMLYMLLDKTYEFHPDEEGDKELLEHHRELAFLPGSDAYLKAEKRYQSVLTLSSNQQSPPTTQLGHDRILNLLKAAEQNISSTALMYAALYGDRSYVSILLDYGFDIGMQNENGLTLLMLSTHIDNTSAFDELMALQSNKGINIRILEKDAMGMNALMHACMFNNVHAIAELLKIIAPNETDSYGNTALIHAVWHGSVDAVRHLLRLSSVSPSAINKYGVSALHIAAVKLNETIIELLLQDTRLNSYYYKNELKKGSKTEVIKKCIHNKGIVEDCIRAVVQFLYRDILSCIHYWRANHSKISSAIVKKDIAIHVNLMKKIQKICTMRHFCASYLYEDYKPIVYDLCLFSRQLDKLNIRATHWVITQWLNHFYCAIPSCDNKTGLMQLCTLPEIIKDNQFFHSPSLACVFRVANKNTQDQKGKTLLMHAIENGFQIPLELFINDELNPNIQDEDGKTALMYAMSSRDFIINNKTLIDKLIDLSDLTLNDKQGKSIYDHAKIIEPNYDTKEPQDSVKSSHKSIFSEHTNKQLMSLRSYVKPATP